MKIIAISGLDGSGKSTQIQRLKNYLESQGSKVFYFHAVTFGLANKIIEFRNKYCLFCRLSGKCKVYKEKSVTHANAFQIWLRKIFLRIDIWRFGLLRNKLRNTGYDYILSDRYFYDSVINIEYLSNKNSSLDSRLLRLSEASLRGNDKIYKPNIAIYLKTDPEIILSRERVPDQGIAYLKAKKDLYEAKIGEWGMRVIDGNQSQEEVFEEIKSLLR